MITYKESLGDIQVRLDSKVIGRIVRKKGKGFAYRPKGSKIEGQVYPTVDEVKKSLEQE